MKQEGRTDRFSFSFPGMSELTSFDVNKTIINEKGNTFKFELFKFTNPHKTERVLRVCILRAREILLFNELLPIDKRLRLEDAPKGL